MRFSPLHTERLRYVAIVSDFGCYGSIGYMLVVMCLCRSGSTEVNIGRLQRRVLDLLHYWLEGYFSVDFRSQPHLLVQVKNFVKEHVSSHYDLVMLPSKIKIN